MLKFVKFDGKHGCNRHFSNATQIVLAIYLFICLFLLVRKFYVDRYAVAFCLSVFYLLCKWSTYDVAPSIILNENRYEKLLKFTFLCDSILKRVKCSIDCYYRNRGSHFNCLIKIK